MAIKGNLRDFTLSQLLNLINLAQKTGTLVVEDSKIAAEIYFSEGKLAYANLGEQDNSLAGILHQSNMLTTSQYQGIKANVNGMSDKELGLLLVNANYFSQHEILSSLQSHFINVLNRLFTWMEGVFRFDSGITPPEDKITVRVNLENIILEGSRQFQELELLEEEIPSLDIALKFVDRPGTNVSNLKLSPEEWQVIAYVDPRNTLHQIGRATELTDPEVRKVVYSLLQAGIIEMIRPTSGLSAQPPPRLPEPISKVDKEESKSLIFRIIDRIRSL